MADATRHTDAKPALACGGLLTLHKCYMTCNPTDTPYGPRSIIVCGPADRRRAYVVTEMRNSAGKVTICAQCTDCKCLAVNASVMGAVNALAAVDACQRAPSCDCGQRAPACDCGQRAGHHAMSDAITKPAIEARVASKTSEGLDLLIHIRRIALSSLTSRYITKPDPTRICNILAFDYELELCFARSDQGVRIVKGPRVRPMVIWRAARLFHFAKFTDEFGTSVTFASCPDCALSMSSHDLADACRELDRAHPQCSKAPAAL